MRVIRGGVGKEKGEKSVTVTVKKQNAKEKEYHFTLTGTNTAQIAHLLDDMFSLFEDKVNASHMLVFLRLLVKVLEDDDLVKARFMIGEAVKQIKML